MFERLRARVSLVAAAMACVIAVPAGAAGLTDVGDPIAPHGFPRYYEDETGLRLEPCLPPPAGNASREDLCIFDPLDLEGPLVVGGEIFWWLADAEIPNFPGGGKALLTLALEGSFIAEEPVDREQLVFVRVRMRIDAPVAGTYTIDHPFGTKVIEVSEAEVGTRAINFTSDIGASNFFDPPKGFEGALGVPGHVGPFLIWPDYATNPALQVVQNGVVVEQYIGDPAVLSPVVGGINGNVFRVQGPEFNGVPIDVETELFSLMGKVFDPDVQYAEHDYGGPVPESTMYAVGPVNREGSVGQISGLRPEGIRTGVEYEYPLGYPLWYQERVNGSDAGLKLTLCKPGDMCISDPIDEEDEAQVRLRTGGESFWWSADALFDIGNGKALLVLGIEGTFGGDEAIVDGNQIAFGRLRIRIDTPTAGTYRVIHPYGVDEFPNAAGGKRAINYTRDFGIVDPQDPDSAFIGTLFSNIGPTVLKWTTFGDGPLPADPRLIRPYEADPALNEYFVGDPAIEHRVTGSPFGTNFFRVERWTGSQWQLVGETDLFTVSGKLFDEETFQFVLAGEEPPPPPPNQAPVALDDSAETTAGVPVEIDVLANDSDPDGNTPLTVVNVTQPPAGEGSVTSSATSVTYTPPASVEQTLVTSFTYQAMDALGLESNVATVTVTVNPAPPVEEPPANEPPVANDDTASTTAGEAVVIDVLANDSDPDGNYPLTVVNLTQPTQGSVTTNGTTVTYTPPDSVANEITTSFTYQAEDALGAESNVATVTVTVSPASEPEPIVETLTVTSATVTARNNGRYNWSVSGTVSDPAGKTITVEVTSTDGTVLLGTATARNNGRWSVSVNNSRIVPSVDPMATVTSSGGSSQTVPVSGP
jgi:hypothetical protein